MRQQTNVWQRLFVAWCLALLVFPGAVYAEGEHHDITHDHEAEMTRGDGENHSSHHHDNYGSEDSTRAAPEQQSINLLAPSGHHHRPPLLPPDQDRAYSEFNHHIAGICVFLAGGLALLASTDKVRFSRARFGWPGLFFLLGVFLLFRHDPESWPHGPLSLQESLRDVQIIQHVIFTGIILGIGVVEWLRCRGTLTRPFWGLIFPALAVSAAFMLFAHKHGEGPSADKIYRHHVIMGVAGIIAMIAKVLDDTQLVKRKVSNYLWAGLMMGIGLMLFIYTE